MSSVINESVHEIHRCNVEGTQSVREFVRRTEPSFEMTEISYMKKSKNNGPWYVSVTEKCQF
jgi:hypothetical protein